MVINVDILAIVQTVFHIKEIASLGKMKRDIHIVDPSQTRYTILSGTFPLRKWLHSCLNALTIVWRDVDTFNPLAGDVILLKRAQVHHFDGRSLNAYEYTEIVLNPERQDCVGLREWWELKELEKNGCLDDFEDDLE
jgi:hypothetical protein